MIPDGTTDDTDGTDKEDLVLLHVQSVLSVLSVASRHLTLLQPDTKPIQKVDGSVICRYENIYSEHEIPAPGETLSD